MTTVDGETARTLLAEWRAWWQAAELRRKTDFYLDTHPPDKINEADIDAGVDAMLRFEYEGGSLDQPRTQADLRPDELDEYRGYALSVLSLRLYT
jgi:hypothetical protein